MSDNKSFFIEADISYAQKALAGTAKSIKSIQRQTLGIAARDTVKAIKAVIKVTTKRRSGALLKAYGYKVKKDGSGVSVYPKTATNKDHLILAKASALSYGADIKPRGSRKFLQITGSYYARPKSVRIAPRNFIQEGEKYLESGAYMKDVEAMIDKELKKYWG